MKKHHLLLLGAGAAVLYFYVTGKAAYPSTDALTAIRAGFDATFGSVAPSIISPPKSPSNPGGFAGI